MKTTTNNATHTPGPWHLSRHGLFVRKSYGTLGDGPKDYNICEVLDEMEHDEFRANARLIAVVPDLYRIALNVAEDYPCHCDKSDDQSPCVVCQAKAAIAMVQARTAMPLAQQGG